MAIDQEVHFGWHLALKFARTGMVDQRDSSGPELEGDDVFNENRKLKLANSEFLAQLNFLNLILNSLPHPFYVIEVDSYRILAANTAAGPGSLLPDTTCHALTHDSPEPCGSAEHPCPLEEIKRTKQPVIVEHIHIDAQGKKYAAEVHAFPVLDKQGNVIQIIEYSVNIARRKRAEEEREKYVGELESALAQVETLRGLLPICAVCKRIRDDQGYWRQLETYLSEHLQTEFSHSYCPQCGKEAVRLVREYKAKHE